MIKLFNNFRSQLKKDNKIIKEAVKKTDSEIINIVQNVTFHPRKLSDMNKIADAVIDKKTAHVNLSKFNDRDIESFKNFMCGILYSIKGDFKEIMPKQFIFSATKIIVENNDD